LSPSRKGAAARGDASPETYETAFAELQHVVEQLENGGGLDLDQVVQLFDRGTALAHTCERLIDQAELRVTRLTAESASPLSDVTVDP
jgi:exodeoxyribonuclease VII small subunit